jgi:hypothetical protein
MMPDLFKHFSDLAIATFNNRHFEPRIIAFANQSNFCGSGAHATATFFGDRNSATKLIELALVGLPGNFHNINFRHI